MIIYLPVKILGIGNSRDQGLGIRDRTPMGGFIPPEPNGEQIYHTTKPTTVAGILCRNEHGRDKLAPTLL